MSLDVSSIPWWTFRIFFILFCSGRGKGESEEPGGGWVGFLLKVPGGGSPREGGGPRGQEGVCRELGGGGRKYYFFVGPKFPPKFSHPENKDSDIHSIRCTYNTDATVQDLAKNKLCPRSTTTSRISNFSPELRALVRNPATFLATATSPAAPCSVFW